MKFPYTLSKSRQLLLSKEDQLLYEYEHSPFYPYEEKVLYVNAYRQRKEHYMTLINEDEEFAPLPEAEKLQLARDLVKYEADTILNEMEEIMYPIISDVVSYEDYKKLKEDIRVMISDTVDTESVFTLNEGGTPGHDITFWLPNMKFGWLGKLASGILTLGAAGLVGLFMAGKDRAAAKKLEKYMNKLVETIDTGVNKKKSFWSFFGRGKNKGDQSMPCFRYAQEYAERTIAKDTLVIGKAAGLLGGDGMEDAIAGKMSGGINQFITKVAEPLNTFLAPSQI